VLFPTPTNSADEPEIEADGNGHGLPMRITTATKLAAGAGMIALIVWGPFAGLMTAAITAILLFGGILVYSLLDD